MAERNVKGMQAQQAQTDAYIKSVAGGRAADEIEKAKKLLDSAPSRRPSTTPSRPRRSLNVQGSHVWQRTSAPSTT